LPLFWRRALDPRPAFNRQYPFVDILLSDIIESEETLDTSELVPNRRLPFSN
jgi:hypothetical protein